MTIIRTAVLLVAAAVVYLADPGASTAAQNVPEQAKPSNTSSQTNIAPEQRRVLFGDLHLHTAYSLDAWSLIPGMRTTPDDAYRFAKGETIYSIGRPAKRAWPLDFSAVTDHSEYIGVLNQI